MTFARENSTSFVRVEITSKPARESTAPMVRGQKYHRCSRSNSTQRFPISRAILLSTFGTLRKSHPS